VPVVRGQFVEEVGSVPAPQEAKAGLGLGFSLQMGGSAKKLAPSGNTPTAKASIFSAEVEESSDLDSRKKRKLIPLEHEVGNHERDTKPSDTSNAASQGLNAKAQAEAVISKIPVERADLFKYQIDWVLVDENKIVEEKMRAWARKKINEYLGEEEQTLIDYVCKKLHEHTPPDQLLESLVLVLEDEAADFVVRLWRTLIYHVLMVNK
jgi:RNA-binding protein 25